MFNRYAAKEGTQEWYQMQMEAKLSLVNTNNVLKVGNFTIKWGNPSHHLAYKRCECLGFHSQKKCSLNEVDTADWERNSRFNLIGNDLSFEVLAKRMLKDTKHLIHVQCLGCGRNGAPTTDNNPAAWHMDCWRICLDKTPEAAEGYTKHLSEELAPRIHKYFPDLTAQEFRELFATCDDLFWLTLFDLKTQGRHVQQRLKNDRYRGIRNDFSLEKMLKNEHYFKYVIKRLSAKHLWFAMGIKYSCITVQSFIQHEMEQNKDNSKTQSVAANSNNQAQKPQFSKSNK